MSNPPIQISQFPDTVLEGSVTAADRFKYLGNGVVNFIVPVFGGAYMLLGALPPELPPFTPTSRFINNRRDVVLSITPYSEGMWGNSLDIAISRIVSRGYEFMGTEELSNEMYNMFRSVDGRRGFARFISRHLLDYFTLGRAIVEIERADDAPGAEIVSLNHVDALRCMPTGDPDVPYLYYDLFGKYHEMRWYDCFTVTQQETSRAGFYHGTNSAAARSYAQIRKLAALNQLIDEKVTGGGHTQLVFVQGVTSKQLEDAKMTAASENKARGLVHFNGNLFIPVMGDVPVATSTVQLKGLPENFDREQEFKIAVLHYAKSLGLVPSDLDPSLAPKRSLGGGIEATIMDDKEEGYGSGNWETQFRNSINDLVMPQGITFAIIKKDLRDEQTQANVSSARGAMRAALVSSGQITVVQANNMGVDSGDIPKEFLMQPDATDSVVIDDSEKPTMLPQSSNPLMDLIRPTVTQNPLMGLVKPDMSTSQTNPLMRLVGKGNDKHDKSNGQFASGDGGTSVKKKPDAESSGITEQAHKAHLESHKKNSIKASEHASLAEAHSTSIGKKSVDAIQVYTGMAYSSINGMLRRRGGDDEDEYEVNRHMDKVILIRNSMKPLPKPISTYRFINSEAVAEYKVGKTFTEKGFMSTSTSQAVAKDMALNAGDSGARILRMVLTKGTKAHVVGNKLSPANAREMEIIVHDGARVKVIKVGKEFIDVEFEK